ncbi:porin family protein [Prosthecochloris sp. N3]|uniref:Porin family protein n=2 Tax=Prosthecochloris ethylica TaxID=2743976 RepID=A0ABR9XNM9_9CHLB|nr:porin family protein [Prosthecochloris ethylica]MBF0635646.1 porin family protein [Prosthecochloris ethylica]NUK46945.1 porin family protein [Prosthecochloris ethylica]
MKKGFLSMVAALFVLLVSASFAQAATPYVSASAGLGILTDSNLEYDGGEVEDYLEYKSGFVVNGALGLDGDMYRVEGAVGYQVNDVDAILDFIDPDDLEVSILSFMANGYVDLEMADSPVTPYVMAGLGVASVDFDYEGGEGFDETAFAYQFGAGVGIQATSNVMVDLGYRYFATSDIDIEESDDSLDIDTHNFMAGVRVAL